MNAVDQLEKRCRQWTKSLLEEATPLLQGEPRVWTQKIGEQPTLKEQLAQGFKAQMPLMSGKLRPDLLVFHSLPTSQGLVHVVFTYSALALLPVDFLLKVDGRLPEPVLLNRRMLGVGAWGVAPGADDEKKDPFCQYLSEIKRGMHQLKFEAKWDQNLGGGTKIKLEWAMQLIPLSESEYLLQWHQPYDWGLLGARFGVKKFLDLADWVRDAIHQLNYRGNPPKLQVLIPNLALLALRESAGPEPVA